MSLTEKIEGTHGELLITDRLTFADSTDFRKKLIALCEHPCKSIAIELGTLTFMDSSGLGMLIVALNECKTRNIQLTLNHPKGAVKSLLEMTHSYERFTVID